MYIACICPRCGDNLELHPRQHHALNDAYCRGCSYHVVESDFWKMYNAERDAEIAEWEVKKASPEHLIDCIISSRGLAVSWKERGDYETKQETKEWCYRNAEGCYQKAEAEERELAEKHGCCFCDFDALEKRLNWIKHRQTT